MSATKLASFLLRKTIQVCPMRPATSVCSLPCATWSRLHLQPRMCVSQKKFSSSVPKPQKQTVTIIFIDRDGDRIKTEAEVGDNLLDVAQKHDVELEGTGQGYSGMSVEMGDWVQTRMIAGQTIIVTLVTGTLGVKVTFLLRDGSKREVDATVGDNILDIILEHDVDIDGFGACEGTLACSTCHLIFKQEDYDKLPSKPTDEELDMLDLAFGLEDTSRLGCQVIVTKDLDGMVVKVPQGVADARSGPL